MKRFWNYLNNTPLNPLLIILFFIIIGAVLLVSLDSVEYFISLSGLGVSMAVVQCALIQNRIQKDNIRIQLFDKRYSVFQSVLDTVTIIKRDNWDRYILFNENDVNKQMISIEENLYKSVQLAVCLFDSDLHSKLVDVNNAFCKVTRAYKTIITDNLEIFDSQEKTQDYMNILSSNLLSNSGLGSEEYNAELKCKFPDVYANLMKFCDECNSYLTFIEDSGIMQELGRYIVVSKLDE